MHSLTYPSIAPADVASRFGDDTFRRGAGYVKEGRVLQCLWNPGAGSLVGSIRGNHGRTYATTVRLARGPAGTWRIQQGRCSCPMQIDCKHVAALLITVNPPRAAPAPTWQQSLDKLLPAAPGSTTTTTPLAIHLALSTVGQTTTLDAALVHQGKRGGWVHGELTWSSLGLTHHKRPFQPAQVAALQDLYSLYQAPNKPVYQGYSYSSVSTINLARFDSALLWPLLSTARQAGVKLIQDDTDDGVRNDDGVRSDATATMRLNVTADASGALTITPTVLVDGASVAPAAFLGSPGHGVVYIDGGLHLAQLAGSVPMALQHLTFRREPLVIPAAELPRFATEYYPRLRSVAALISTDGSYTPPEISGPTLVLHADYRDEHQLELTWYWSYGLDGRDFRNRVDAPAVVSFTDIDAERLLLSSLDAPLEDFRLRCTGGALVPRTLLGGMDTVRFTSELAPRLAALPGVLVEVTGEPADYRDSDGSLVIGVSADAVAGETDWFDLGITISVADQEVPFRTVFTALAVGQDHLLLPDGAYFSLDRPELVQLRILIEEARTLTDTDTDGSPRITRFQADLFDELAALGVIVRQADEWRRQAAGLRALQTLEPVAVPTGVRAELRAYQREGFSWLATLYAHGLGGILADDMGLGKTLQTLALISHVRQTNPGVPPFLVVAPASVVGNWAAEAARFTPDLRVVTLSDTLGRARKDLDELVAGADLVVTSYTLFRLDFDAHAAQPWSGLILDEAQNVKNRQTRTYQCARRLVAPVKIAITGTPMENNLMELWSLLSITAPGLFPSPSRFAAYYAKPIEKDRNTDLLALFRRRIKPLVKRRTKELVAPDLPAKQDQILDIDLTPRHRRIYDKRLHRERQLILGLLDDADRNRFAILKSLTVLRQLALHPGLVDPAHSAVPSAKIDSLSSHLQEVAAGGHRALVFSQFTRFLGQVRDRLDADGIDYCYLDGRTRNRTHVIDQFKNGAAPVFLISLKAGGFGLNLTEADYCFLLDPWWNPAVEAQAIDRIHRIGQLRNVMAYRLIARDTIEDKVLRLNARKAELFASVIDDGGAFGSALTAEDIRELIA
ncbi:MAG: DEAD/DEAH box helicase [Mycobacterium sp.]